MTTSAAVATAKATMAPETSLTSLSMRKLPFVVLPEKGSAGARRTKAQCHCKEMADEDDVAQHHQAAARRAPFQVRQGQCDRIHERPGRVQHGHALQPAASRQADKVDCNANC